MSTRSTFGTALTSTIALKVAMAVSGLGMVGFVLFHMLGNLQVFRGQEAFNDYAEFMQGLGGMLWIARAGLLGFLVLHVASAITLAKRNMAARPVAYDGLRHQKTSLHARFMLGSGIVILLYVLFHLAHFTAGVVHPEGFALRDAMGRPDVYTNLVLSFQNPLISGLYILANAAAVGPAIGAVVLVGNLSMPLAVLLGAIGRVN